MSESTAMLFGRLRQPQTDPATGQPIPRSRPVLDAIKAALTELVKQGGTALGPLLLQLAQKYLGQLAGAASADGKLADAKALVTELHNDHPASAASVIPDLDFFLGLLVDLLNHVGPVAIDWLVDQLHAIYAGDTPQLT